MTRAQLEHAIRAAGAISGDRDLYVVGSQAILGAYPDAHPDLLRSMEVDVAPREHPEREDLIEGSIGKLSPFHETFGFYVDGVEIDAVVLPERWAERLVVVDNANTNGFRGLCLHPVDIAVSKLAAGREKDLAFVGVLLREGLVAKDDLSAQIDAVRQLAPERRAQMHERVARLAR